MAKCTACDGVGHTEEDARGALNYSCERTCEACGGSGEAPQKKPYAPPKLRTIGTVRDLTQKIGSVNDDRIITGHTREGHHR